MSAARYRLGRQFVLRMTGFPVEEVQALRAPELPPMVDALAAAGAEIAAAQRAVLERMTATRTGSSKVRKAVERGVATSEPIQDELVEVMAAYHAAVARRDAAQAAFQTAYAGELDTARKRLYAMAADERFRSMLLLSQLDLDAQLDRKLSPEGNRTSDVRQFEARLVAYIQRLTTKNETISFFGPSAWGTVDAQAKEAIDIELGEEVAERAVYLESWACENVAEVISHDAEVRPLLCPVLADAVVLEEGRARLLDQNKVVELDGAALALARRCDGRTRAVDLGPPDALERLVADGVVEWQLRLPMTATPFADLRAAVSSWPEGHPARARWLAHLDEIDRRRADLERAVEPAPRREALGALRTALEATGSSAEQESKALYASRLPINEDCRRGVTRAVLGGPFVEQAVTDLAPWYELWRDLAGLYATRLYEGIAPIWRSFGGGPVRLPELIAACRAGNVAIHKAGGMAALPGLEGQIQAAWREQLGDRAAQPEVELTADDLAFVRNRFSLRRMKTFDMPAPDLQVAAPSMEAVRRGDWRMVLGELHPDFVHWQNVFFLWCPDIAGFTEEYRSGPHGPTLMFGRHLTQTSAHTALLTPNHAGDWTSTGGVPMAHTSYVRSAELWTELTDDDVVVRRADGQVVGSLVHNWSVALNTHQLELIGGHAHTPRLRVGRVVVQRESWFVTVSDELGAAVAHATPEAFVALRRFRAEHGFPEEVFVWPQLPTRLTLHKDAKPTFVDFRSPLLLELFAKSLRKYPRLRVVEMLPSTSDCWLEDARGRYSCELRLLAL